MKKAEINRKFDEIVAFAGVDKFIDTPAKRYSSGMYVRLAFAVAAHTESEVLLVDEVLAVGDAAFQKKCMGKMGEVAKEGRTVLFVSHNMAAIQSLCSRAVLLEEGAVQAQGEGNNVIGSYLSSFSSSMAGAVTDLRRHPNRHSRCTPILSSVTTRNNAREATSTFGPGDDLVMDFYLEPPFTINGPTLGVGIDNAMGLRVFSVISFFSRHNWDCLDRPMRVECIVPGINLVTGRYTMNVSVGDAYDPLMDSIDRAAFFDVEANDYFGTGKLPTPDLGVVLARSRWEFQEL
jgi:lipopolysaccharide transport system ATP-binding protein